MAQWMGAVGFHFEPLAAFVLARIREGERIFADETADSDEAGHAFQHEAGHQFRSEAGRRSDLKPATQRSLPRIEGMMFRRAREVKPGGFAGCLGAARRWGGGGQSGRSAPSIAP